MFYMQTRLGMIERCEQNGNRTQDWTRSEFPTSLEKAYEERSFQLQWLNVEPRWDSLRSDPRFADPIRRIGLPQ